MFFLQKEQSSSSETVTVAADPDVEVQVRATLTLQLSARFKLYYSQSCSVLFQNHAEILICSCRKKSRSLYWRLKSLKRQRSCRLLQKNWKDSRRRWIRQVNHFFTPTLPAFHAALFIFSQAEAAIKDGKEFLDSLENSVKVRKQVSLATFDGHVDTEALQAWSQTLHFAMKSQDFVSLNQKNRSLHIVVDHRMVDWLIDWFGDSVKCMRVLRLIDWLICKTESVVDLRLIDWLGDLVKCMRVLRLIDWLICKTESVVDLWLIDWLIDWVIW